jgi:hypothetical protein
MLSVGKCNLVTSCSRFKLQEWTEVRSNMFMVVVGEEGGAGGEASVFPHVRWERMTRTGGAWWPTRMFLHAYVSTSKKSQSSWSLVSVRKCNQESSFHIRGWTSSRKAVIRASYDTWSNYITRSRHRIWGFPVWWKMTHKQSRNSENIDCFFST